ncbi:MAG TPA: YfcE family phosphodiesterase [Candidatus Baltobacteraceae bacterium]|nr:YfcE family phosphodiesterase [Candidatus Baltobacteraceae bacterium]
MRLLVVSDIHGNWPALQAIREEADAVLCLGDIVSYGPFPRECVAWVRECARYVVRGNHDSALAFGSDPQAAGFKRHLAAATMAVHRALLAPEDVAWLQALPTDVSFRADDYRLYAVHATPKDPLFSYQLTPDLDDEDLKKEVEDVRADLIFAGHTHLPMSRGAWTKVVVNPGSVGQPLDGDPRASYAIVQDGVAEIRRAEYDIGATIAGIRGMGLADEIAAALVDILRKGSAPQVPQL